MWTLMLLLLLAGHLVLAYGWLRERRAHAKSRRALEFWRGYRESTKAAPTTVRIRELQTDASMAAVREILAAKVAAHRQAHGGPKEAA